MNNKTRGEEIDKLVQDLAGSMISGLTIEGKKKFIRALVWGFATMSFKEEGVEEWFNEVKKVKPKFSDWIKDRDTFTVNQLIDELNLEGIKGVVYCLIAIKEGVYQ